MKLNKILYTALMISSMEAVCLHVKILSWMKN